jgi:hypothetical protein
MEVSRFTCISVSIFWYDICTTFVDDK